MTAPAIAMPFVQGTPAWVDARRDVIGSSDISILTGNSPYKTSVFSLWAVKTRLAEPEPVDPETQELFDLGHAMEDVIATRYELITGRRVKRQNRLLVHPRERWRGASLDRVDAKKGARRIVEVKWVPHRYWLTDGPEPVPAHVQDQVQWQLAVTGYDVADVAVLNGSHVEHYEVGPNGRYQDDLRYIARDFWDRVEHGERPDIDGSEATEAVIKRMRPRDTLGLMEPTPEVTALVYALRDARAAKAAAESEDRRIRSVLRWLLDQHSGVEDTDYRVHFRRSQDKPYTETDWQAVAAAYRLLCLAQGEEGIEIPEAIRELTLGGRLLDAPTLDAIEGLHTVTGVKEGTRSLLPKFRSEETGKWY